MVVEITIPLAIVLVGLVVFLIWTAYRHGFDSGVESSDVSWMATVQSDAVISTGMGDFKLISAHTFWALFYRIRECEIRMQVWPRGIDTSRTEEFLKRVASSQAESQELTGIR